MLNENNNNPNMSNNKNISKQEKNSNINKKIPETLTTFESKKYNDFLGVFGAQADSSKYFKSKKDTKKIQSKTPTKKGNDNDDLNNKERHCKTPIKLNKFLFFLKKKDKNKINNISKKNKTEIKKDNKDIKANNIVPIKKNKNSPKVYELSFYEPFNEVVNLLDGEGNSYQVAFMRHEFEINIIFNNIYTSLNDIIFTKDFFSFPQYSIYEVKYNQDNKITLIKLKDYRSFKIQTDNDEFYKKIIFNPKSRIDYYKYAFLYNAKSKENKIQYPIDGWKLYDAWNEYKRQKVPVDMECFRPSQLNKNYKLCETYPSFMLVPSDVDDSTIIEMVSCRSKKRFPLLTYCYTHENNNDEDDEIIQTFLFRSSQINIGLLFKKNNSCEIDYINALTSKGKSNKGFIFYDCRPYISAKANALKGAGTDEKSHYLNCKEIIFGNIENIHAVKNSFKKAIEKISYGMSQINNGKLSCNQNNSNFKKFLSKFEESKWLDYLSDLLTGANVIINRLKSRLNVICHCSDGWDRTSQVCSLVQIILDPYFRTFEGFAVLIEKDWISFGHQFAIRNGCDFRPEKKKERSPIFIQFLHAVYQIMIQYPTAFEFQQNLLIYLSEEIYSNKFGTFLFNCEKELEEHNARETTVSIWSDIFLNKKKYMNPYYKEIKESLDIKAGVQYLNIWKEFFYKYIKIGQIKEEEETFNQIKNMEKLKLKQTDNIIELLNIIKKNGLEKEIENNELYKIYNEYLNP